MSVITSKSTMLSILKTPGATPRTSLHRVRFQLPSNIKKIFLDFKNGFNIRDYENLVCVIRDSEINDSDLLSLISEAKNCTSLLNYDLRLFVQAVILVKWTHRNEEVVKSYQEFINDLVSAHSCHTKLVLDQLIKLFLVSEESEWIDTIPSELLNLQFNNIHLMLQTILTIIPMSEDILIDSIKHNFPYLNAPSHKQVSYLYNLLKIIQYQPNLRISILQIAIDKMMLMDVQSPKEEIIQYEENSDNLLLEVEDDELKKSSWQNMKHPVANTLDLMMYIIYKFIKSECHIDEKIIHNRCQHLYHDILVIFESVILPTHACHHVQYIIFYLCSFEQNLAQEFLKFLWKKVISPSISPVIRQLSVAYLSSFLARANFLTVGYLKTYLTKLSNWVHEYITHQDLTSDFLTDYKHHTVFYSVCQAMFYLIAFRHQDLVNSSIKLVFLQSLNLPKIVSCKLNPLKFCLPAIVDNFAAVTRAYQLAYCYTIIENNARASLPIVGNGGQIIINPVIDMYFPFDPYVLLRTKSFITPLYREYKSIINQDLSKINKRNKNTVIYNGPEDEDDFIGEENLDDHNFVI